MSCKGASVGSWLHFMDMPFWSTFLRKMTMMTLWIVNRQCNFDGEGLEDLTLNHSLHPPNPKTIKYPNSVVLNPGCTLESLGKLQNYQRLCPTPRKCDDLIGLGVAWVLEFWKIPSGFYCADKLGNHSPNWRIIITLAIHSNHLWGIL